MKKDKLFIGAVIILVLGSAAVLVGYLSLQRTINISRMRLQESTAKIVARYAPQTNSIPQTSEEGSSGISHDRGDGGDVIKQKEEAFEQIHQEIQGLIDTVGKEKRIGEVFGGYKKWDTLTDEQKAAVILFYEEHRDLILKIRELAKSGGPFRMLDFSKKENDFWDMSTWLGDMTLKCWLLLIPDAFVAAINGNYDEAAKDYIALLQFATALNNEPLEYSQHSTMSMIGVVYKNLKNHVPGENIQPELIMDIISRAKALGQRNAFVDSFKISAQRASEGVFDTMREGDRIDHLYKPYSFESAFSHVHGTFIGQPFIAMDENAYMDLMDRSANLARLPFYEAKPLLDRLNVEISNLSWTNIVSRAITPHCTQYLPILRACYDAQLGLMQVGLAVELYHGQHGVYPETLDEIATTLNDEIPLDPFTGRQFVYEPGQDGFTLFSQSGEVAAVNRYRLAIDNVADANGNIYWRQKEKSSHH